MRKTENRIKKLKKRGEKKYAMEKLKKNIVDGKINKRKVK